ncbi:MAG: hypothetical protein JWP92_2610 [Caulobacter sp.]|nr:hypothetical protein [Caulobacter sp.]
MAKAQFIKNQRVWVESVGAWATVERVVPAWTNGVEEPTRITYDVGLGRMFHASELTADPRDNPSAKAGGDRWRVSRARNKWRTAEDTSHHPVPGTHPIVFTDLEDWGGWRAPRAEYDRDPHRVEAQARLIANAPRLHGVVLDLITLVASGAASPEALRALARRAAAVELDLCDLPSLDEVPAAKAPEAARTSAPAAAAPPHPTPPATGMTAASLTERMAALESELHRRPVTGGAPPAAPKADREFFASPPAATFARGRPK